MVAQCTVQRPLRGAEPVLPDSEHRPSRPPYESPDTWLIDVGNSFGAKSLLKLGFSERNAVLHPDLLSHVQTLRTQSWILSLEAQSQPPFHSDDLSTFKSKNHCGICH